MSPRESKLPVKKPQKVWWTPQESGFLNPVPKAGSGAAEEDWQHEHAHSPRPAGGPTARNPQGGAPRAANRRRRRYVTLRRTMDALSSWLEMAPGRGSNLASSKNSRFSFPRRQRAALRDFSLRCACRLGGQRGGGVSKRVLEAWSQHFRTWGRPECEFYISAGF